MKIGRHHLIRPLVVAAAIVGIAAPAARAGHQDLGLRPDDRAGFRGTGVVSAPISTPVIVRVTPGGFDWGDAGVGAAGVFGLMLLAGGVAIVSRHGYRSTA